MDKKSALFLVTLCLVSLNNIYAQNNINTFYSTIRNHSWTVSSYLVGTGQLEKKSHFDNYTFRFSNRDSSVFNIDASGINNRVGYCRANRYGMITFSLPLVSDESKNYTSEDSLYNDVAKQFSTGQLQLITVQPTTIKFRLSDPFRGEVFIELMRKD